MVEAEADRGGAVRVLRISHSATVAAWRGRNGRCAISARTSPCSPPRGGTRGSPVTLVAGEEGETVPVRTWGSHPALFVYDPVPLWRALGEQWDVIDIHEEPFALATVEVRLLRALRGQRAPYVLYTAQNLFKRYPIPFRWLERAALRGAAGVSACNTEAARIAELKGFAGRARVIPLGVDPQDSRRCRAGVGVDDCDGRVRGAPRPEKGIDVLLDAVARTPLLHARFAGSGPLASSLATHARRRGIADRVTYTGVLSPAEVPAFYRSLDVLAVPSVPTARWTEQFGRVAVEAMASGVPVVSSDAGALPDVVGGAGIVVPHSDAAALADALLEATGPAARSCVRRASCARRSARGRPWRATTSTSTPAPGARASAPATRCGDHRRRVRCSRHAARRSGTRGRHDGHRRRQLVAGRDRRDCARNSASGTSTPEPISASERP